MSDDAERAPPTGEPEPPDADPLLDPALLDRMTDAFFAIDDEWRFTYLNDGGREVIEEAAEGDIAGDLVGTDFRKVVPAIVGTVFYERYREAMETQEPVEFEAHYDPLSTWFEVRAFPSESGLSVFFRDVTERRNRRAEIRSREEVLRGITETIADPELDFEERVSELLRIGAGMLGTAYGALSRIRDDRYVFEVVYAPDNDVEAGDVVDLSSTNCERVVVTEESMAIADVGDDPELSSRPGYVDQGVSCYLGAPVRVDGSVYGTFCFYGTEARGEPFEDWQVMIIELLAEWVSSAVERQVVEEGLRRQNDRLEEFAGIVSHDLRNPLAIAKGQTELAAEECESEHLEKARHAHGRMEEIVSDVLTMARSGTTVESPETVELSAAAREAWATVDTADATLTADGAPTVTADESRLIQLLENLFRNAVEHGGPDVHVTVSSVPGGFAVADDGPGIPPEDRESVFEHGYSTRKNGTGFGLSIVREIAEAHGWSVSADESDEGGARFEFVDGGV